MALRLNEEKEQEFVYKCQICLKESEIQHLFFLDVSVIQGVIPTQLSMQTI